VWFVFQLPQPGIWPPGMVASAEPSPDSTKSPLYQSILFAIFSMGTKYKISNSGEIYNFFKAIFLPFLIVLPL